MKLDLVKAYDHVNRDCLLEILKTHRFCAKWIGWIEKWLSLAKATILVNGEPGREIICRKGLRQGDTLSLLFYIGCRMT